MFKYNISGATEFGRLHINLLNAGSEENQIDITTTSTTIKKDLVVNGNVDLANAFLTYRNGLFSGVIGVYSQVQNATVNQTTNNFQTMINTTDARGSLLRQANTAQIGSTFTLRAAGALQAGNNQQINFKFLLGTIVLADTLPFSLKSLQISNQNKWFIDLTIVVKQIGNPLTAQILTTGNFTWNDVPSDTTFTHIFDGFNATTYETVSDLTFDLQASFVSGAPGASALNCDEVVIQKIF